MGQMQRNKRANNEFAHKPQIKVLKPGVVATQLMAALDSMQVAMFILAASFKKMGRMCWQL